MEGEAMICPYCDSYSYVYKTYKTDDVILRQRRCLYGSHEILTMETIMLQKNSSPPLTGDDIVKLLRNERGFDGEDVPVDSLQQR
jgi:transcriptional regulator NrdR family protein